LAAAERLATAGGDNSFDETVFAFIAQDIEQQGYSIRHGALPENVAEALFMHQRSLDSDMYTDAGIGRGERYLKNEFVRTDEICWISGNSAAGRLWLDWASRLQGFLNRRLFLGLFSFESHFAHYAPGQYYKRHYDAFRGETNRILSIVAYLNPNWTPADSGELVLYSNEDDLIGTRVAPLYATVVVFLSEEFPHEVLPANRDRYSVAGWFRVNSSLRNKIDPPR
jgi:SM-20-related protein